MVSAAEVAAASAAADLAGEPREIVLHRLEFRDFLLEGDALVGIAHADVEHAIPARPRSAGCAPPPPISISEVWSNPFGAGLMVTGATLSKVTVSLSSLAEVEAGLDPAFRRIDQRDRVTARALRQHRDMLCGLGKGNAARAAGQGAVGIERDAVFRACRRDRHLAFGGSDFRLRQQPSGQHGFGQRHRNRKASGRAQHAKAFGEARA